MIRLVPITLLLACGPTAEETGASPPPDGSAGCTAGAPLSDGDQTITVAGETRDFILRLPERYTADRAWPVVFALHPNGTGAWYWDLEDTPQDVRTPFAEDAILVFPDAIGGHWRDYDADASTWAAAIERELAYLDALHTTVNDALCVDETRQFAMGFSGGGSFSYVLACERAWVRAIAVGGAVLYVDPAICTHAPAGWVTIGQGEMGNGRLALRDQLLTQAGCAALDEEPVVGDEPVCVDGSGCDAASPVTYCTHPNGHIWPGFATPRVRDFFLTLQ